MQREWGQPVSDDEHLADRAAAHAAVPLREYYPGSLDAYDWTVLETIVWIATRDERAVRGAAGYLASAPAPTEGLIAPGLRLQSAGPSHEESLLNNLLPRDVGEHHDECAAFFGEGVCSCEELGRTRYCRCPDRLTNGPSSCGCTQAAIHGFLGAFRGTLTVRGRRDGDGGFGEVTAAQRVGASVEFSRVSLSRGRVLRLLKAYDELRIPVTEIKNRWPADFADWPIERAQSQRNDSAQSLPKINKDDIYRELFCKRLRTGQTKTRKPDEVKAIRLALTTGSEKPKDDTIDEAIRPFWPYLQFVGDKGDKRAGCRGTSPCG